MTKETLRKFLLENSVVLQWSHTIIRNDWYGEKFGSMRWKWTLIIELWFADIDFVDIKKKTINEDILNFIFEKLW